MNLGEIKEYSNPSNTRSKRLENLNSSLSNSEDASALAMLMECEGHLRYYKSHPERNYSIARWEPVLRIHMVDESLVRWASKIMGGTHVSFDRSVGAWYTEARGLRVIEVLHRIRPFVRGEKIEMVDCILSHGKYMVSELRPCGEYETGLTAAKRIRKLKTPGLL